jgi:hypothetical protein
VAGKPNKIIATTTTITVQGIITSGYGVGVEIGTLT